MLALHRERGAVATIALHHVEDARAFGLVHADPTGGSGSSWRSPTHPIPGDINAGTYLLDPAVLAPWTAGEQISIERDVFPAVIEAGHPVFGFLSDAYWLDLGTPAQYLQAHFDLFEGKVHGVSYPSPWVDATAVVDIRAHLGRWVAVGPGAAVGAGGAGRRFGDPPGRHGRGGGEGRRVRRRSRRAGGRGSDPHGMRSGRRVLGSRGRRARRRAGAGGHGGGPRVDAGSGRIDVVRCRFRPNTLPMRRIRLFALVVAVSAAILPAASARAGDPFTLYGSGWGHGLGLSQWGAYGLASDGWTSTQILTHFYSGTKVSKVAEPPADIRVALATAEPALHLTAEAGPVRLSVKRPVGGTLVGKIPDGETWVVRSVDGAYEVHDADGASGRRHDLGRHVVRPVRHVRRPRTRASRCPRAVRRTTAARSSST